MFHPSKPQINGSCSSCFMTIKTFASHQSDSTYIIRAKRLGIFINSSLLLVSSYFLSSSSSLHSFTSYITSIILILCLLTSLPLLSSPFCLLILCLLFPFTQAASLLRVMLPIAHLFAALCNDVQPSLPPEATAGNV